MSLFKRTSPVATVQETKDLIQKKAAALVALQAQSEAAITTMTAAIAKLENANTGIAATRQEISEYQKQLFDIDGSLGATAEKNTRIAGKLKDIFEID